MEQMLSEVFKEILEKKFKDGEIEKLISASIDKCLADIINNLFSRYDSDLKKQLEEKVRPVISNVIADCDMTGYVEKLTILTNQLINQREISNVVDLKDKMFDESLGRVKKYNHNDKECISNIFKMYKDWVQGQLKDLKYNDEDWDYDDGVEYVIWNVGIEQIEEEETNHRYFKNYECKYRLYARPENEDDVSEFEDYDFNIEFSIYKGYTDKKYLSLDGDITLKELSRLPKFLIDLYYISTQYVEINQDIYDREEDVEIEIEKEYD